MLTSPEIAELAKDLAKAQLQLKNAHKDNRADAGTKGSYSYFDLAQLRDISATILAQHNLMVTQTMGFDDGQFVLHTRLLHTSGQWIQSTFPLPMVPDRSQVIGSALTYARRYSWSAIIGLHGDKDDDGKAAEDWGKEKRSSNGNRPISISARDINPYHKAGGPSEYVSRVPGQMLDSLLLACETLDEVADWWDKQYIKNNEKINHATKCQLTENMIEKALKVADNAPDLRRFFAQFQEQMDYLASMKPDLPQHWQQQFETRLLNMSPLEAG